MSYKLSGSCLKRVATLSSLLLLLTFILHLNSYFGLSKLSRNEWTENRAVIDSIYPEIMGNRMSLRYIYGSQLHHGDGLRNLHQTTFSQAIKLHLLLLPRGMGRPGVCYCKMHSEMLCASKNFFFLEVYMSLVEMLFCPFMHTSSLPKTVYCANL